MTTNKHTVSLRRAVSGGLATGIGIWVTGWWAPAGPGAVSADVALLRAFRLTSAVEVGREVAKRLSVTDSSVLIAQLLQDLSLDERATLQSSTLQIAQAVFFRVRDDFAAGRTVNISGWRLSETEARLAVLAAHRAG